MPSPRTTQRCAKCHPALAAWEREFFLIRFAGASVVTESPVLAASGHSTDHAPSPRPEPLKPMRRYMNRDIFSRSPSGIATGR